MILNMAPRGDGGSVFIVVMKGSIEGTEVCPFGYGSSMKLQE
jgi:hypothetical protein